VLLWCLGLYIVFSLACALVTSFDMLLVLRVCQAMGSGGLAVLPGAIIRDRLSGDRMARTMSMISMTFLLVPILAPSIGQFVLLFAGWRYIFVFLAVMAAIVAFWVHVRLPETLNDEFREPASVGAMMVNMWEALIHRGSFGYVVGGSLTFGAMVGYVTSSQQLVGEHFGAGRLFPVIFGGSAVLMAFASFSNSRIVERFGARRVSHTALLTFIAVSALQVVLAFSPHETLWQFMPVMAVNMGLIGFIGANFNSISLQPFARTAGAASSVQAFMRMVIGSLVGIVIGQAYDGTARPLAIALLLTALSSLSLVLFSEKGKLFRRLLPPGTPRPVADH
jgi:DHA1 family bicyclomycin/chloramphenicol resistance-like MFS transporter